MRQFTVFWGCTIPVRLPSLEKATRALVADLGWEVIEPEGFTCCPETQLVRTADEVAYYATAARNLIRAREHGRLLVTPCSGCYSTFKQTASHLRTDKPLRQRVSDLLGATDLSPASMPEIWHLAQWLCDEIGPDVLRRRVARPLSGMRLAVHYGCHLLRPTPAVGWDHPLAPTKLEQLLKALGATVVDYASKMDCCGSGLERAEGKGASRQLLERKLTDLRQASADALVVACPACFLQFDLGQVAGASGTPAQSGLPVFYLAELLSLALGHSAAELGLELHRVPVESFLAKWEQNLAQRAELARHFDLRHLQTCASCGACDSDCPAAASLPGFVPSQVIASLLAGELKTIVSGPDPWRCLECMTCLERCHSRLGMASIFETLKRIAREQGHLPSTLRAGYQSFLSAGVLGTPRASLREKLGLPSLPPHGGTELRQLLDTLRAACETPEVATAVRPEAATATGRELPPRRTTR